MSIDNFFSPIEESPSRGATVEDEPDDEDIARFVRYYPSPVAQVLRRGESTFEEWRRVNEKDGRPRWAPFANEEEWKLAHWLLKNVGQNKIDEFLKLDIIKRCELSIRSKYTFFQCVDQLPEADPWIYDELTVTGDVIGEDGKPLSERLDLWRRDPVECIRELIGKPALRDSMGYAPEQVFADSNGTSRIYDEMWSGDWWWNVQGKLPAGATIAPVILASDKTKLSQFRGDQTAWPVYLSIGNIAKATRREVTSHATVLVGYIPVTKLSCFSEATRSLAGYRLFHQCMKNILDPLVEAGAVGVEMTCADGWVRRIFPIVAAYVADFPEQCLVANVRESFCPRGLIPSNQRGEPTGCLLRSVSKSLDLLDKHKCGENPPEFHERGMRPVYEPFWRELPHCDIFACLMPDIMHQLHKGVFKDHLVSWCTKLIGDDEMDHRFMAITDVPGLRYFKKGISHVTQWTNTERKEMQKVFVALLVGAVSAEVLAVVQATIDFIYIAQYQQQTTETLKALRTAYDMFHRHKDVFVDLGVREHFNIPKVHAMFHYFEAIEQKGALDGYNTELAERLHIDFAKEGYRAGNHRDYIAHMTTWLQRQEAADLRVAYLDWLRDEELKEAAHGTRAVAGDREAAGPAGDESDVEEIIRGKCQDLRFSSATTPRLYRIAVRCPSPRTPLIVLEQSHGASEFLPALKTFVRHHFPQAKSLPNHLTRYNVYKQLKIERPWNRFVSTLVSFDKIHATAPVPARGRSPAVLAHLHTALVIKDPMVYRAREKGSLDGKHTPKVIQSN
ncbi:hypothetical protein EW026_g8251 [Hermanssonia centrifuga]|uniref:Uncharacterized protein n=1 Tax=Hermanssonia centrifuga TaxID=98765 RepID=A0A4S4K4U7_9APHY|nr:hypothetical protein EW026_g8251 [Hermanssonia centrifuga]